MSKRLYSMLCDVIDHTYAASTSEAVLKKYKAFYLEYANKFASSDSSYSWKTKKIIIRNLFQDDSLLLFSSIRSLAHHIDFVNRGNTNNDWQYLAELERLLRSTIEMGLISFLQIKDIDLSDKEQKIIYKLEQEGISADQYKDNAVVIRVYNSYNVRSRLREHGYYWLSNEKVWEKEINQQAMSDELSFLEQIIDLRNVTTHSAAELLLTSYMYILVYESYNRKDELKANGYSFDSKERAWKKRFPVEEVKLEMGRLSKSGFRTIRTKSA